MAINLCDHALCYNNKCHIYFLVIFLIISCGTLSFAWDGVIVDKETGKPISKAVIVRCWVWIYVGGTTGESETKEMLSDKNGQFSIINWKWRFYIPGFSYVTENKPIVYKPGYKFCILDKKESRIKLEKIPTIPILRKKELEAIQNNYEISSRYNNCIFMNIVRKEEEFLERKHYASEDRGRNFKQEGRQRAGAESLYLKDKHNVTVDEHAPGESDFKNWINTLKEEGHVRASNNLIKYGDLAANVLIQSLHDEDWRIRREAAYLLSYVNNPKVVESLISALSDSDNKVISSAVFALGEQRNTRATNALIQAFHNQAQEVRYKVADALRKIKDPNALYGLITQLHDPTNIVRKHVVEALGAIDDIRAAQAVINSWHDMDREVRGTAADIIVEMGIIAMDTLISATLDEDSYFRWRAAMALGTFKDTKAVMALIHLLNDDAPEVRWMAIEALGEIRDGRAIEPLAALLNDADSGIKEKAEEALMKINNNSRRRTY